MRRIAVFPRTWPFLTLGLFTFLLFLAVGNFGAVLQPLVPVLRVLIVPLWVMRTVEMLLGMGGWPGHLQLVVALPLLFAPYILADLLWQWIWRRRIGHPAAAS